MSATEAAEKEAQAAESSESESALELATQRLEEEDSETRSSLGDQV